VSENRIVAHGYARVKNNFHGISRKKVQNHTLVGGYGRLRAVLGSTKLVSSILKESPNGGRAFFSLSHAVDTRYGGLPWALVT
jgi:hypothetical protein